MGILQGGRASGREAGESTGEVNTTWTVAARWHRARVDRYVSEKLRSERRPVNKKRIHAALRSGAVRVNGRRVARREFFVKQGDTVTARLAAHSPLMTAKQLAALDWAACIVYEDDHMVVVDKPAGMASAPAPAEEGASSSLLLTLNPNRVGGCCGCWGRVGSWGGATFCALKHSAWSCALRSDSEVWFFVRLVKPGSPTIRGAVKRHALNALFGAGGRDRHTRCSAAGGVHGGT